MGIFEEMQPWAIALFCVGAAAIIITIIRIIIAFIYDAKVKKYTPSKPVAGSDSIDLDGRTYYYQVSKNNLHIQDSWILRHALFKHALTTIKEKHPDSDILKRSIKSMCKEWATHNMCYILVIKKSQTQDVDLNYPQKWYAKVAYWFIGSIAYLLIV